MREVDSPGWGIRVLVVDPVAGDAPDLASRLDDCGTVTVVRTVAGVDAALAVLDDERIDCVVCRHDPPRIDGATALSALRRDRPLVPFVLATERTVPAGVLDETATDVMQVTDGEVAERIATHRIEATVEATRTGDRRERVPDDERVLDGVVVHDAETGAVVESSGRIDRLLGIDPAGREALSVQTLADAADGYTADAIRALVWQAAADGDRTVEWTVRTAGGDERRVAVRFTSVALGGVDHVLALVGGVTEPTERERTLERYETVVETLSDVVVTVDERGVIQWANPALVDVLGYDPEAIRGTSLTTLMSPAFAERHQRAFERYLETGERSLDWNYVELPAVHRDGHEVPVAVSFSEYEHAGERFFAGVLRDITERRKHERTLNGLLDATRTFVGTSGEDELVEAIVDGAAAVFDYELSSVRLHDADAGTLPPSRISDDAASRITNPPTYDDDEGPAGEAFQSGTPRLVEEMSAAVDHDYAPIESAIYLPIGDHGVFAVGAVETDAFDEEDVALIELLVLAATSAFDRLEQEHEMRQLQRVVEHVDEKGFLVDASGRFTYVTRSLATYLGYDRDRLTGTPLTEVVVANGAETCADLLATVRARDVEESHVREVAVVTAGGETHPVELELSPTGGSDGAEIAGVVLDISELEATRSHLATERERFQELFENLPDPVAEVEFVDGEPIVHYVNPAFVDEFGYDRETVRGANLNELIVPGSEREDAATLDQLTMTGGRPSAEVQRETATGRRDFLLRGIPYSDAGRDYGFAVYTDITEQKERERYLQVVNRVLRHNLRNDLNVVLALADRLARNVEDEELADHARTLQDSAADVAAFSEKAREIEDLLGGRGFAGGPVDVATQVRTLVADRFETDAGVDLSVDLPAELWVAGDESVRRACEELIENAVEHNDAETPTLAVSGRVAPDRDDWVELRVRDDGPGIPDEEWRIVSGETDITQLTHGSGLGLWLTRWIVESCGGELHRERRPNGTTVVLGLPRASPDGRPTETRGADRT